MSTAFDPEILKGQLAHLRADRERIDRVIESLETVLRNIEGIEGRQNEFRFPMTRETTLHDGVKGACMSMKDGITRQRVLAAIEREHPYHKPKSASIAASLLNLTKGEHPMLQVAIEGRGRSPSSYSTEGSTTHRLGADEIKELLDESTTKGTGGWQSLFASLHKSFDKASGMITLTAEQRARIYHYHRSYGGGGWQDRVKRIFRRELPHLFAA